MWYNVLEVAKYIISRCSELGNPVSNLKLQKMLYFVWIEFYKRTGRTLFFDDICAWQLGPVIPTVYYEFCQYAGQPIFAFYSTEINKEDKFMLDEIIDEFINVPAHELVQRTHRKGTAWDEVYQNGAGNRKVIPYSLIKERDA